MQSLRGSKRGPLVVAQSIYDQSVSQKAAVGTRLQLGERVFYYAKAGAALIAGQLAETDGFGGSDTTIQTNLVTATSMVPGSKLAYATLATDAAVADQFAEGYFYVYDGNAAQGVGQTYKIKSHAAIGAGGAGTFNLYDEVVVATLAGTSKAGLIANPFQNVAISAITTPIGMPIGVPLIAVTIAYYAWIQTWGPVAMLKDGTSALNTQVVRGTVAAGAASIQVAAGSSIVNPAIGFSMDTAATTKYGMVFLQIVP